VEPPWRETRIVDVRTVKRAQLIVLIALAVTAVAAPAADAKVWFADMEGRLLRWDQQVSSAILGYVGNDSCGEAVDGVTVYLRGGPSHGRAVDRRRLKRLARISGGGKLQFRMPHVAGGRYHLVARVKAGKGRRWLPVSAAFRVVRN
jgi:hypothetical protein